MKIYRFHLIFYFCFLFTAGCEEIDVRIAAEAGLDAVKAITLADKDVQDLADKTVKYADNKHQIAPVNNRYNIRLERLVRNHLQEDGIFFNYKVYLNREVNAFALANGSIRIYSGLMDMLDDGELRFVIGHEVGHVVKNHIRKKVQLAFAASAVRKTIASQNNIVGEIARSQMGGFAELVMGAQFSQHEEKEADDYGMSFLKKYKYGSEDGISALEKLAALGNKHTFLSSHPDPDKRGQRLKFQSAQNELPAVERDERFIEEVLAYLGKNFFVLCEKISNSFWIRKEHGKKTETKNI